MKKPRKLKKAERNVAAAEKQLEKVVARILRKQTAKQKIRNKKRAKRDRKLADAMGVKSASAPPKASLAPKASQPAKATVTTKASQPAKATVAAKASSSTVAELRDAARVKGVTGYSRMTKTQLLDALR